MPESTIERRKSTARRHVRLPCILRFGAREVRGHTLNVSVLGLQVVVPLAQLGSVPQASAEVGCRLLLPSPAQTLWCEGSIAWSRQVGEGAAASVQLGIAFFEVDTGQASALRDFLDRFQYTVVVVERDAAHVEAVRAALEPTYRLVFCSTAAEALKQVEESEAAAVLLGDPLEGAKLTDFLTRLAGVLPPSVARIVGSPSDPPAVMAPHDGFPHLFYWLQKPYRASALQQVVQRGTEAHALALENERLTLELERINDRLQRQNSYLRAKLEPFEGFEGIVGQSAALHRALAEVRAVCKTDSAVHIHGETGTGKELIAWALHAGGRRKGGAFIAQNCASVSDALLQSTLFGHRRGAFTGADRDHRGVFEQASGGTLFLDEVAELSKVAQAGLLRALETGTVTPLGSTTSVKIDVRLVSATHRDLAEEAAAGRFREDLLFRLLVVPVQLPPLRDREGDIALLAAHFLKVHSQHHGKQLPGLSAELLDAFARYRWPGNVRELENEIERLVVLADDRAPIPLELLSPHLRQGGAETPRAATPAPGDADRLLVPATLPYDEAIEYLQRSLISRALDEAGGRLAIAAEVLGVERSRLGKLRKRLERDPT